LGKLRQSEYTAGCCDEATWDRAAGTVSDGPVVPFDGQWKNPAGDSEAKGDGVALLRVAYARRLSFV
jgi:hypothetical protein